MALTQVGQIKNSPIPATMQSDAPAKKVYTWLNAKGDGVAYGMKDLLEDITAPLKDAINLGATDWNTQGTNKILTAFIAKFELDATLSDSKKRWMQEWTNAFKLNPTQDMSLMISNAIKAGLKSGWVDQAKMAPNGDDAFLGYIDSAMTTLMDGMAAKMPKFIDIDVLENDMLKQVKEELAKFNLVPADGGLDEINSLETASLDTLEIDFSKAPYQTTSPNRPYRIFNQASASKAVLDNFKFKFHQQSIADEIVKAAFDKAISGSAITDPSGDLIPNLQTILGVRTSDTKIDTRLIEVLKGIASLNLKETPVEIFDKLLGVKAGEEFIKWYKMWDWLIEIKHSENFNAASEQETVSMDLKLRNDIDVIPAEGSYPVVKTIFSNTPLTQTVSTPKLHVASVSYITDLFKKEYEELIGMSSVTKATVSEDDLSSIFGSVPIKDGDSVEGVIATQLETLDPNAFSGLQAKIDGWIKIVKSNIEDLYPSYKYDDKKVHISFKVSYSESATEKHVIITPKIVDDNVETLPAIDWTGSSTAKDVQDKIDAIFKDNDKTHKSLDYGKFSPFSQKVVSALDNAVTVVHKIFEDHQMTAKDNPFKIDVVGNLAEGDEIPVANFEDLFGGLKDALNKFDLDNKSRFTIKYIIENLSDKTVQIKYEITDTNPATTGVRTKTVNGDILDNISLIFNESLDKGQSWLDKLQKEKVDKTDFSTRDQVDALSTRTPLKLTDDELNKAFNKFEDLQIQAQADGVTLEAGKVQGVVGKDGGSVYFQQFISTFTSKSGDVVTHDIKMQFSHNFLSQEEIDNAKTQVDKDATAAGEAVDQVGIDEDKAAAIKQSVADQQKKLKDQLDDKDVSEETLKGIEQKSSEMIQKATSAAAAIKKEDILSELKNQFPDGNIPDDIQKLFDSHWSEFEDIIKNHPELLKDAAALKKILDELKGSVSLDSMLSVQKSMQESGKIALMALGGLLGGGALLGGANAMKVATTNKKAINGRTGKIKSSKKLAVISALIGLASLAGSIGTFVYVFLVQGGL